ncbi:MAG: transaldolase, partial [Agromyces sp.]
MTNPRTQALSDAGVSIWLDDLSRDRIKTGNLAELIENWNVVGVTTNPTIFAGALSNGESYAAQLTPLAKDGVSVTDIVFELTTTDVAEACDLFARVYEESNGYDGRVSIEVEPGLAHDAAATVAQAQALWAKVNRPNAMIKIPATVEGLTAISDVIAEGISVNVTLIFSLDRYRQVIDAYLSGLERAQAAGHDLTKIHSVASFFVSRVDTEIDRRLTDIGTDAALSLKSLAGIANARLAYELFETEFASERARALISAGANLQRPLWASTGVK